MGFSLPTQMDEPTLFSRQRSLIQSAVILETLRTHSTILRILHIPSMFFGADIVMQNKAPHPTGRMLSLLRHVLGIGSCLGTT